MESKMEIMGGRPLKGSVEAQGAKNASLPVMAPHAVKPAVTGC